MHENQFAYPGIDASTIALISMVNFTRYCCRYPLLFNSDWNGRAFLRVVEALYGE